MNDICTPLPSAKNPQFFSRLGTLLEELFVGQQVKILQSQNTLCHIITFTVCPEHFMNGTCHFVPLY
jgi:hypothetical protein